MDRVRKISTSHYKSSFFRWKNRRYPGCDWCWMHRMFHCVFWMTKWWNNNLFYLTEFHLKWHGTVGVLQIRETNSMEQSSSWEADRSLAGQEISCILWNQRVHHIIQKGPLPTSILSQIKPFKAPPSFHFLKININITLLSIPGSSKLSLSPQVSPPKPCMHLSSSHTCRKPHRSYSFWSDHSNYIW